MYIRITVVLFSLFMMYACQKDNIYNQEQRISIITPTGGEVYIEGARYPISWTSIGVNRVDIDMYRDASLVYAIADNLENSDTYLWTIMDEAHDDSNYFIRISDSDNNSIFSEPRLGLKILPGFERSSFVDERDGRQYATVKIGDDWWMAENLRFESQEGSFFYNNLDSLGKVYGRLYSLEAARNNAPSGWHLATDGEWKNLEVVLGMKEEYLNLESERSYFVGDLLKVGGGSGFDALYGGYYNSVADRGAHIYQEAHFWTSTWSDNGEPIIRIISKFDGDVIRIPSIRHSGCSVRYVKNKLLYEH